MFYLLWRLVSRELRGGSLRCFLVAGGGTCERVCEAAMRG